MTSPATPRPLFEGVERHFSGITGGLSLLLHLAVLVTLSLRAETVKPVLPVFKSVTADEQSFEIETIEKIAEKKVEDLISETEGGNDLAPTEPSPKAPVPVEKELPQPDPLPALEPKVQNTGVDEQLEAADPTTETLAASEAPSDEDVNSHVLTADVPGEDSTDEGTVGGRGKGFGPGSGIKLPQPIPVDLFHSFLENLPHAGKTDPAWSNLPWGAAGQVRFEVTLNAEGQLQPIRFVTKAGEIVPAHLRRAITRNQKLLRERRFTLYPGLASGSRVFLLVASIDRRPADRKTPGAPGVQELGLLGLPKSNGSYFTYYSGQQVSLLMYQEY